MPVRDRLTKRAVEALQPGTIKSGKTAGQKTSAFFCDGDVRGFGVRMAPGGKRVYIYNTAPKMAARSAVTLSAPMVPLGL